MKKSICFLLLITTCWQLTFSQYNYYQVEKLKTELVNARKDSVKCRIFIELASAYRFSSFDSSRLYADSCVNLSIKIKNDRLKAIALSIKGFTLLFSGRLPESLQCQYAALKISEQLKDTNTIALTLNRIGNVYMELGDYNKANEYYFLSRDLYKAVHYYGRYHNELSNIGNVYNLMKNPDSALFYLNQVYEGSLKTTDRFEYTRPEMMFRIGNAYTLKNDIPHAISSYRQGIVEANTDHDMRNLTMNNLLLAKLYLGNRQFDSSIKYAAAAYDVAEKVRFLNGIQGSSELIAEHFARIGKYDSAYKYLSIFSIVKDSITGKVRLKELQQTILDELEQKRSNETLIIEKENKQKQLALIGGLILVLVVATYLYRNNKQKQKVNAELEKTLFNLKVTQNQLIQSEKMASLGELTAGIAHEIQNPLNFVNNFSEVNTELIDELYQEVDKGNLAEVKVIAKDIKENEQKINHHGKRADAIVKGMLQHSRSSSGKKEPTDINALCDEYLRLSYHGLRAKDKSFNASMKTDFDNTIGAINIIPQDIGRVILNLLTNAFYVVDEKKKSGVQNYEPTVSISTKKMNDKVEISVRDNGNGIPQKVLDKIFQPFFTTKPTGEGTGLGLSLSYDIITKGHGGELKVQTKERQGTTFTIQLPKF